MEANEKGKKEKKDKKGEKTKSRVYRHKGDCSWKDVLPTVYKEAGEGKKGGKSGKNKKESDWTQVARHSLVAGLSGEQTKFHLRYFEVSPGGYTSLEAHRHEHVVVVVKGRGKVRLGRRSRELGYLDVAYISPMEPHRLYNPYEEPFGFFCIVDALRDRPVALVKKPQKGKEGKRGFIAISGLKILS